jgi:hypothetical protein
VVVFTTLILTVAAPPRTMFFPGLAMPFGGQADLVSTPADLMPAVVVRVINDGADMLSLSIPSAPCTPRVILAPAEAATLGDCFRHGVVYQAVAVFYDRHVVHARRYRLVVASQGAEWVFHP